MGMPVITPGTTTRPEAITDIIESVALEQAALSHILNAEGEKIQKIIRMSTEAGQMLAVNTSVKSMVNAITQLELILQSKLALFECCLCPPVVCTTLLDTTLVASNVDVAVTKNSMTSYSVLQLVSLGTGTLTLTTNPAGLPISVNGTLPTGITLAGNVLTYADALVTAGKTVQLNVGTGSCLQVVTITFAVMVP